MSIYEFLLYTCIEEQHNRIDRLEELKVPSLILNLEKEALGILTSGSLGKVNGEAHLLDENYINHVIKRGNGGKVYIVFNDDIYYFPEARYGIYVKRAD